MSQRSLFCSASIHCAGGRIAASTMPNTIIAESARNRRYMAPSRSERSGGLAGAAGEGTLATQSPTLPLAHAAPDAELLAVDEGVLQAVLTDDAASTDLLGLARGRATLGEEEVRVDAEAVRVVLPGTIIIRLGGDGNGDLHVPSSRGGTVQQGGRSAVHPPVDGNPVITTL